MFRALLSPSSGVRDYYVDYHIGFVLGLLYVGGWVRLGRSSAWAAGFSLQTGHYSKLPTLNSNIQQTKNETTNVVNNIIVASS